MSHFATFVIVESKETAKEDVERLLAPYDEGLHVEPYSTKCSCVGMEAYRETRMKALVFNGYESWDDVRSTFRNSGKKKAEWDSFVQPIIDKERELLDAHSLKDQADHDCEECKGTGTRLTTYNPKSKWDWYTIGGRWQGDLGKSDIQPVKKAIGTSTFAIVTPDGKWHERGKMGWWAIVSDEKDKNEWNAECKQLLESYPDKFVVLVDCHI